MGYYVSRKKEISIQEALEDIQYRDKIKMDYAISQNYAYLAIPIGQNKTNHTKF